MRASSCRARQNEDTGVLIEDGYIARPGAESEPIRPVEILDLNDLTI
ncbi:MAG: hypothetical protein H0W76_24935 [Pyrinomonadaceae bacterium]|nr:hypothetical protein [Pyrinomonadaceae bacterium]